MKELNAENKGLKLRLSEVTDLPYNLSGGLDIQLKMALYLDHLG